MKTIVPTIGMLIAISFASLEASGQSARRDRPQDDSRRNVSATPARSSEQHTQNKSSANLKTRSSSQKQSAQSGRSSERNSHTTYNSRSSSDNKRMSPGTASRSSGEVRRDQNSNQSRVKISTTNQHNPKSTYRKPTTMTNVGKTYRDPKASSREVNRTAHNSGGNHLDANARHDRYYPYKKEKIRVHPVTYNHHYKVMYYPAHKEIVWTPSMYHHYVTLYPGYSWRYPVGYRIRTISVFDTRYNVGEVTRVYGRVYATWFNRETDDLLLFFGGEFPHQEFTMVVPGRVARRYSWRPERFFLGQHVYATGLITSYDGNPEMIIKKTQQIDVY